MKQTNIKHPFRPVRANGVPISLFQTADPAALMAGCVQQLNGTVEITPIIQWDCVKGLTHLAIPGYKNALGREYVASLPDEVKQASGNAVVALSHLASNPPIGDADGKGNKAGGVVFFHHLSRFWDDPSVMQALWNCRDVLKSTGTNLVLMTPGAKLPGELRNDVPTFEENPPTEDDIKRVALSVCDDAGIDPASVDFPRVIDSCLGYLSEFRVEQSLALGRNGAGFDFEQLWRLKVQAFKQTSGLEITLPRLKLSDLVATEGFKNIAHKLLNSSVFRPRCVLWLDEIEKMLRGSGGGDLSGTTDNMLSQLLTWMQMRLPQAILLLGIPGGGKSLSAECLAGEAAIPLLRMSMGEIKGGIVGQSEAQMSAALSIVDAIGQGQIVIVATCNSLEGLPPEILSRFRCAQIFYDYPTPEERQAIWEYCCRKHNVPVPDAFPPSRNWVGREIDAACEKAHLFGCSLDEASATVVPVSVSSAGKMKALRESVSGRFLAASHPGIFSLDAEEPGKSTGRKFAE